MDGCLYVWMDGCLYVYACTCICISVYIICLSVYVCVYVCMYVYTHVCIHTCMHMYTYYVWTRVCTYVYVCICMFIRVRQSIYSPSQTLQHNQSPPQTNIHSPLQHTHTYEVDVGRLSRKLSTVPMKSFIMWHLGRLSIIPDLLLSCTHLTAKRCWYSDRCERKQKRFQRW